MEAKVIWEKGYAVIYTDIVKQEFICVCSPTETHRIPTNSVFAYPYLPDYKGWLVKIEHVRCAAKSR